MTPLRIGKAIVCLVLIAPISLRAQDQEARVTVTASPNPVPEHESLQLQIQVDTPLSTPVLKPTFDSPDLTVMGEPGLNFTPENGEDGPNTRKKLVFTFVLMPKRVGDFMIRNIQVKVGKQMQVLSAGDQRVKVIADTNRPPDDESANPASPAFSGSQVQGNAGGARGSAVSHPTQFNSDFTVFAQLSKQRAYVGEPVVVEYYLYDFGHLRQTEIMKWPTFDGFWKDDLELTGQIQFEDLYVKNQEMRRAFIARYALYGIKPGKIQVDKLGIRGKYISNESVNPFFGFDMRKGEHQSQNAVVEVLPLPETGRPALYGGAVGRFALKLDADKVTLPQNSPVTLTLTLTGVGNFQAIDSIKIPLPADFEIYESSANGRPTVPVGVKQSLESKKTFQVIAIPRKAGKFEVPAVSWSFFNPEKEAYETLTTSPLSLEVTESLNSNSGVTNSYLSPQNAKPGQETKQDNGLRYLKPVALDGKKGVELLRWAIWAALALNFWVGFHWLRSRSRSLFRLVKSMDRFSEARIMLLQAKGIRDSEWQAGLEEVALMIVQVLLNTNARGHTKQELEDVWRSNGLPAPLFQRVNALLEELDRHRFSSQKLTGSGTKELRSRLTKETESLLIEASRIKRK